MDGVLRWSLGRHNSAVPELSALQLPRKRKGSFQVTCQQTLLELSLCLIGRGQSVGEDICDSNCACYHGDIRLLQGKHSLLAPSAVLRSSRIMVSRALSIGCSTKHHESYGSLQSGSGLPPGWEVRHSQSKNLPYYFNPETKDSRWEPPTGTDSEQLAGFMAANHTSNGQNGVRTVDGDVGGKIRAAHLLVKHRDSRRPSSWKEAQITRTKEEALRILKKHQERIDRGETSLGDLAMQESDCSSARKRGDL